MTTFVHDLRVALRGLARRRGFAAVAIGTLALAVGANTAIFSLVEAVLLRPLPFPEPERLVMVWETQPQRGLRHNVVNPGNFLRWQERSRSFAALAAMTRWPLAVSGVGAEAGESERLQGGLVTGDFFASLGARPALGRLLGPADTVAGHENVVVLSHGLWQRRFGGRTDVVGSQLRIEGVTTTIVGVAAPSFGMPPEAALWVPVPPSAMRRDGSGRWLTVVGRLAPGVELAAARAEMSALADRIAVERPEVDTGWGAEVVPLREELAGKMKLVLGVMMGAVGLVLLIGCANVAGLLLARAAGRQRELAVRQALGAGQGRLVRQFLIESLPLALSGGGLGLLVGWLLLRALLAWLPIDLPSFLQVGLDPTVLAFTAAVAVGSALLSGLAPALARRPAPADVLRGGGTGGVRLATRHALVVGELALSLILLAATAVLVRSLDRLTDVDPGFDPHRQTTLQLALPSANYPEPAAQARFFAAAEQRLAALPGVESAGGISWLPLGGPGAATTFTVVGQPAPAAGAEPVADIRVVTPGLFATLGVPVRHGRALGRDDTAEAPTRIVINETAGRELLAPDPIGRRLAIHWGGGTIEAEIVGVVGDLRLTALDQAPRATVYFAQAQQASSFMTLVLRSPLPAASLAKAARAALAELDPEIPIAEVRPLSEVIARSLRRPVFTTGLFGSLALLALLLTAVGSAAVAAYAVACRRPELGVRAALGARPWQLFTLALAGSARLLAAGLALGLLGAVAAGRLLTGLLFETRPLDPLALGAAVAGLAVVVLVACAVPALAASRVDPLGVLRSE